MDKFDKLGLVWIIKCNWTWILKLLIGAGFRTRLADKVIRPMRLPIMQDWCGDNAAIGGWNVVGWIDWIGGIGAALAAGYGGLLDWKLLDCCWLIIAGWQNGGWMLLVSGCRIAGLISK